MTRRGWFGTMLGAFGATAFGRKLGIGDRAHPLLSRELTVLCRGLSEDAVCAHYIRPGLIAIADKIEADIAELYYAEYYLLHCGQVPADETTTITLRPEQAFPSIRT